MSTLETLDLDKFLAPLMRPPTAEELHALACKMVEKEGHNVGVGFVQIIRKDGTKEKAVGFKNSRVSAGAQGIANLIGSASANPFNYIALSVTAITPANGDTTLSGECTTQTGLTRALATFGSYTAPSSLGATATYQLTKTFTNSYSSAVTINYVGCFNASSSGTMLAETSLPAAQTLNVGDSLAVTWTFTI